MWVLWVNERAPGYISHGKENVPICNFMYIWNRGTDMREGETETEELECLSTFPVQAVLILKYDFFLMGEYITKVMILSHCSEGMTEPGSSPLIMCASQRNQYQPICYYVHKMSPCSTLLGNSYSFFRSQSKVISTIFLCCAFTLRPYYFLQLEHYFWHNWCQSLIGDFLCTGQMILLPKLHFPQHQTAIFSELFYICFM